MILEQSSQGIAKSNKTTEKPNWFQTGASSIDEFYNIVFAIAGNQTQLQEVPASPIFLK